MTGYRVGKTGWGLLGIVSLCVVLGCIGVSWANRALTPPAGLAALSEPTAIPTFRLPSVDGATIDSASLQGKVVVVRFWATW